MKKAEIKKAVDYKIAKVDNESHLELVKGIFELMVKNQIDIYKCGDMEITRKSYDIQADNNRVQLEAERTKQKMAKR